MAATVTNVQLVASGPRRLVTATITLDSSYATSGETVSANALGLTTIDRVFCNGGDDGYLIQPNVSGTNILFLAYGTSTSTNTGASLRQVTSAMDLSAVVFDVLVTGL